MVIRQGDVFWVELDEPIGSEPAHRRPFVIVQNDALNSSRLRTVVGLHPDLQSWQSCHRW